MPKTCACVVYGSRVAHVFTPRDGELARTDFVNFGVYDESTRENAAMLCFPAAVKFQQDTMRAADPGVNGHAVAVDAAHRMSLRWGTPLLQPDSMIASMACGLLPQRFVDLAMTDPSVSTLRGPKARINHLLRAHFGIEVPVFSYKGAVYCRVSCTVFSSTQDCERLCTAVLHFTEQQGSNSAKL